MLTYRYVLGSQIIMLSFMFKVTLGDWPLELLCFFLSICNKIARTTPPVSIY